VTAHRLLAPRWLATGGAVLLAGVVGIALLLQNGGSACAAPPTSSPRKGKATYYDLAGGKGNCSFKAPADDLYVALGPTEYSGALSCGSYIDVTGPKGRVRVKVVDSCPECTPGWLDLSRTAFKKIANEIDGVVPITYKAVPNAPTPGPLSITFDEGSSQYWWAVLIDNHANPIKSVQAKGPGGSWMTASHADWNVWIIDRYTGEGPFSIKMTDIYGHTATATNIKLLPNQRQATSVRLNGKVPAAPAPNVARPAKKKASPSASPSPAASSVAPLLDATRVIDPPLTDPPADLAAVPAKKSCG
jgi:expansin